MITTYTGKWVDLLNMQLEDIDIVDIAHALSNTNRFGGHLKKAVSVAQHSVYVSRLCRNTPYRLQALLHDASEAYIADVTYHLKRSEAFAPYRELEDQIQRLIFRKFGVDEEMSLEVRIADRLMVRFEAMKGFHVTGYARDSFTLPAHGGEEFPLPTPEEVAAIGRWAPWDAKWSFDVFMAEFRMALDVSPEAQRRAAKAVIDRAKVLLGADTGNEVFDESR